MIGRLVDAAARRSLRPRPAILVYHRIAEARTDPWGLAVSPRRFRRQVAFLARRRSVLDLTDFIDRLARGTLPRDAVAITFDDGYVDNLHAAEPVLAAAGLPATLFVVSGMIDRPEPFWWDELAAMILDRDAPLDCQVDLGRGPHPLRLPAREAADRHAGWRAWKPPRTARQAAFVTLSDALQSLPSAGREKALAVLRHAAPAAYGTPPGRAMTGEELRGLATRGTFGIGAHTVTHPALPTLDATARAREIEDGRTALGALLGRDIAGFAYPHGKVDGATRQAVADAGYAWACTVRPMAGRPPSDPFALPRIIAPDRGVAGLAFAMAAAPDMPAYT